MAKAMRHARKVGLLLFPSTTLATFSNHRWVLFTKKVPLSDERFVIHGTKLLHPYIHISREQSSVSSGNNLAANYFRPAARVGPIMKLIQSETHRPPSNWRQVKMRLN